MRRSRVSASLILSALACSPDGPLPDIGPDGSVPEIPTIPSQFRDRYCANSARAFLEVEALDGPWRAQTNLSGFSGNGFMVSNAGGIADTAMCGTFTPPAVGRFAVWARGYRSSDERQFSVAVAGERLAPTHAPVADERDSGFHWERSGEVVLTSTGASVELCVYDEGRSYEVADAVLITDDLDCAPDEYDASLQVLDRTFAHNMLKNEVLARAADYGAAVPTATTLDEWSLRRETVFERLQEALGIDRWPERTPLNVEAHGTTRLDGYSIERVSFESQPGFIVPANIYVPDGAGPFPVIVHPVGHWGGAKADVAVTLRMQTLARFGYLGITYDPFGQGERARSGNDHNQHFRLLLSGMTNTTLMVWDTVRALDVVLARTDADPSRVGITGASGGGLNTLYAMLFDDRFTFAAPAIYVSPIYDFMATNAGHDACSRNPIGGFTDRGEVMALFAPRPMIQLIGDRDALFPLGERSGTQASHVYGLYDASDAFEAALIDTTHQLVAPMRTALYRAVSRHMGHGLPEPVEDASLPAPPADALQVFSSGFPASKKAADIALEEAERARSLLPMPNAFDADTFRARAVEVLRVPSDAEPAVTEAGELPVVGRRIKKFSVAATAGIEVPVFYLEHENPSAPLVVVLDRNALPDIETARLAEQDVAVAYVSVRGHGETASRRDFYYTQNNIILQDPTLVLRAFDLHQAVRALRARIPDRPFVLLARGLSDALVGLVAQSLWLDFDKAVIDGVIGSWMDAFGNAFPEDGYVHRILHVGDVPHFIERARLRPLRIVQTERRSLGVHWPEWEDHQADVLVAERPSDEALFDWIKAP